MMMTGNHMTRQQRENINYHHEAACSTHSLYTEVNTFHLVTLLLIEVLLTSPMMMMCQKPH